MKSPKITAERKRWAALEKALEREADALFKSRDYFQGLGFHNESRVAEIRASDFTQALGIVRDFATGKRK